MGSQVNIPLPNLAQKNPLTQQIDVEKAFKKTKNYLSQLQQSLNVALNSLGKENFDVGYQKTIKKTEEANEALKDFVDRLVDEGIVQDGADVKEAYRSLINKIISDANEVGKKIEKAQEELDEGFRSWVESEYVAVSDLGKYEKLDNCTVEQSAWAYAISFITREIVDVNTAAGLLSNTNTLLTKAEFTKDGLRFSDNQVTTTTDEAGNEIQVVEEKPFGLLVHPGGIKFQFNDNGTQKNIGYIQSFPDGTLEDKIYFNNIHAYNVLTVGNSSSGFYDVVVKNSTQDLTIKFRR